MVASWKPCVLGNMPKKERAILSQSCLYGTSAGDKMYGDIRKGDYIVPEGHNNGFAKAISPEKYERRCVREKPFGVAWKIKPVRERSLSRKLPSA